MISNVITLVVHDLAVAFKNKTILLIIFIPLFVYGTLMMVDCSDAPASAVRLGFLETEQYDSLLKTSLESAPDVFAVSATKNMEDGMRLLKGHNIDGLVVKSDDGKARVEVLVLKVESRAALAIAQRFSALQRAVEGSGTAWISNIRPLQSGAIEVQALPTWILMVVLLVAFFVIPAQVAEEKEKQLLLGLLQTPMREGEWLVAKLLYGIILMTTAVSALQLLGRCRCTQWAYLAMLLAGSFCFCALGVALGLLCRSQASARTLGVICYLPLLLPVVLSDMSQNLRVIAPFLPSYAFYWPIQSIIMGDRSMAQLPFQWLLLVGMGTAACLLSYRLIKVRWLM